MWSFGKNRRNRRKPTRRGERPRVQQSASRAKPRRAASKLDRAAPVPDVAAPLPPRGLDLPLLACTLALLGLGLAMVYSSSAIYADTRYGDGAYFLKRQIVYALIGLGALYLGWRIDYRHYRPLVYVALLATLAMLALLLVNGIGTRVDGATRWFRIAGLSFQPSELAKLVLAAYLAHSLAKKRQQVRLFSVGFLPCLGVAGLLALLVLLQPDLGTAAILMAVTLLTLFVAGTRLSYIVIAILAAAPLAYHQIVGTPWRLRRVVAFLDPWAHRQDAGYQISESLISVGSGGVFGLGLGAGKQKLFFLPAAHTDFIFAMTGEELGLVGLAAVVVLFAIVTLRGVRAALGAADLFGTYLAFGILATITLQALLHMAVVLGLVPTKGIPLPLFSYGGSGLVVNLLSIGILLNIAARNPAPVRAEAPASAPALGNRRRGQRVVVAG